MINNRIKEVWTSCRIYDKIKEVKKKKELKDHYNLYDMIYVIYNVS